MIYDLKTKQKIAQDDAMKRKSEVHDEEYFTAFAAGVTEATTENLLPQLADLETRIQLAEKLAETSKKEAKFWRWMSLLAFLAGLSG